MEQNNFKVRYIRLNEPCNIVIQRPDPQVDYRFIIGEVYFKEYENTFDIFFVMNDERKFYMAATNMQKSIFGDDTVMFHMNALNTGYYRIDENSMRRRLDGLLEIKSIDKLEEDIYGTE